jgi:hypothetical protein
VRSERNVKHLEVRRLGGGATQCVSLLAVGLQVDRNGCGRGWREDSQFSFVNLKRLGAEAILGAGHCGATPFATSRRPPPSCAVTARCQGGPRPSRPREYPERTHRGGGVEVPLAPRTTARVKAAPEEDEVHAQPAALAACLGHPGAARPSPRRACCPFRAGPPRRPALMTTHGP